MFYYKPDYVIHCAGYNGGIEFNRRYPADVFYRNTLMALNIIRCSQLSNVKKVVSVMTSCAYADNGQPVLEETEFWNGKPNSSIACHGYAKRTLDAASQMFYAQYGLNAVTVCINNMYGPGDTFDPVRTKVVGALIRKFVDAKQNGLPKVECWGTGKPLREFVYVKDAAHLLVKTLEQYEDHSLPLNISSPHEISIKDLSETIARLVGYEGEVWWNTEKGDGQMKKSLSIKRMKDCLGDFTYTDFELGLKETIDYYYEWEKGNVQSK